MALTARRGFTLIEVLAAAALFALLGVLLLQVMQGALEVWGRGERVRELQERAEAALDLAAEELRHVFAGPGSRFLVSWRDEDGNGDGRADRRSSLLRFACLPPGRGGEPGERLWFTDAAPGGGLPRLLHVARPVVGGRGSLLDPELAEQADRMRAGARVVLDGVLRFEVALPTPAAPLSPVWDSTRALVAPGDPAFPFGVGPASLLVEADDVFPPLVRLTLHLAPDGAAPARLAEPLGEAGEELVLAAAASLDRDGVPEHVWVEGEWMAVRALDGRSLKVERGPLATRHEAGTPVYAGRRFERWVAIPAARPAESEEQP